MEYDNARSPDERDLYATELTQRFDALIDWAVQNWPNANQPLEASDFSASRRELSLLLGARLHQGNPTQSPPHSQDTQYVNLNPAPWP
jgi:hypothetical protein